MVLIFVVDHLMFHRCACVAIVDCVLRWPIFRCLLSSAHITIMTKSVSYNNIKASSTYMEEKLVGELFPNTVEYAKEPKGNQWLIVP